MDFGFADVVHRRITIVATVDEVCLIFEDRLLASHARHWDRGQYLFDPVPLWALDGRPHLKSVNVASPDVSAYQDLMAAAQ